MPLRADRKVIHPARGYPTSLFSCTLSLSFGAGEWSGSEKSGD